MIPDDAGGAGPQAGPANPAHEQRKEKKRSGLAPWLLRPRAPSTTGWSSPGEALRAGAGFLLNSPQAAMLRIALGAAVALHAAWFSYALWNRSETGAAAIGGPVAFPSAVDMRDAAGMWGGGRPVMGTIFTGLRNIMDPDAAVARAQAAAESAETPAENAGEGLLSAAADADQKLQSGDRSSEDKDKKDKEKAAGEGAEAAKLGGAPGPGASGGGGGQSSSASIGASPAGAESAGSNAGSTSASQRTMSAAGGRRLGRTASSKSAMGQLKFADKQSALGKGASSAETAFGAADAAFQGQTAGPGGAPIGGAGAGVEDGSGLGQGGSPGTSSPSRQSPQQQGYASCPSGYYLKGESCAKIESDNKTPYQGLAEKAKIFLMMAAALALVGIFLLTQPGVAQIIGGIMLGAAAALAIAAIVMGNKIGGDYGQKDQQKAISQAGDDAMKGQAP